MYNCHGVLFSSFTPVLSYAPTLFLPIYFSVLIYSCTHVYHTTLENQYFTHFVLFYTFTIVLMYYCTFVLLNYGRSVLLHYGSLTGSPYTMCIIQLLFIAHL